MWKKFQSFSNSLDNESTFIVHSILNNFYLCFWNSKFPTFLLNLEIPFGSIYLVLSSSSLPLISLLQCLPYKLLFSSVFVVDPAHDFTCKLRNFSFLLLLISCQLQFRLLSKIIDGRSKIFFKNYSTSL